MCVLTHTHNPVQWAEKRTFTCAEVEMAETAAQPKIFLSAEHRDCVSGFSVRVFNMKRLICVLEVGSHWGKTNPLTYSTVSVFTCLVFNKINENYIKCSTL